MRRSIPLLLLLAIGTASATGVLNVLLGMGGQGASYSGSLTAASVCPTSVSVGYEASDCGSLSPATDPKGSTIYQIYVGGFPLPDASVFSVESSSSLCDADYFTTITVNGVSFNASAATCDFTTTGTSATQWFWDGEFYTATGTYAVTYH